VAKTLIDQANDLLSTVAGDDDHGDQHDE
jgi:hypothetical protein